jgi:hypothetical protein
MIAIGFLFLLVLVRSVICLALGCNIAPTPDDDSESGRFI